MEVLNLFDGLKQINPNIGKDIASLFAEPLNPVAPKAQKKVPIPEGLDLDSWINEPEPEEDENGEAGFEKGFDFLSKPGDTTDESTDFDQKQEVIQSRGRSSVHNPYILTGSTSKKIEDDEEDIPIMELSTKDIGIKGNLEFLLKFSWY